MHLPVQASRTGRAVSVQAALARHQERRDQGIPTLSVLVGSPAELTTSWRAWLASHGRAALVIPVAGSSELATAVLPAWLHHLRTCRHLLLDRLARTLAGNLTSHADTASPVDGARLLRMSQKERAHWLSATAGGERPDATAALCEWLCRTATDHPESADEALVAGFQRTGEPAWVGVLDHTSRLLMGNAPGLGVCAPAPGLHAPLQRLFAHACQLADAAATLPVALIIEPGSLAGYLAQTPESRLTSRIRRGLIRVGDCAPRPAAARALADTAESMDDSMLDCEHTRGYLLRTTDGAPELLAALAAAALARRTLLATRPAPTPGATIGHTSLAQPAESQPVRDNHAVADRARSAAERLLFLALQAHPRTHGLFSLNQRIDIRFGQAPMEVDLMCTRLRLAVEVDGYYHFRDSDAYRRDRRKDLLLQTHDFLVMRFLADDVTTALDRVMETIIATIDTSLTRQRRVTPQGDHQ